MKKVTLLVAAALLAAVPAFGAQLLNETFSYANGSITAVSAGLWANHSGTPLQMQIVGGEVELVETGALSEDANRAHAAAQGKVYACLEARLTSTNVPAFDNYFAHFRTSANPFNFRSRVFVAPFPAAAPTGFTFGLAATSSGTTPTVPWGVGLNFGQTYRIVHSYDPADGSTQLWVNPVSEASASITSAAAAAAGETIDSYAFRQSSGNWTLRVDNLTVGETFSEVCDGATPASSSSWGRLKTLYR